MGVTQIRASVAAPVRHNTSGHATGGFPRLPKSLTLGELLATDTKKRRKSGGYGSVAHVEGHPPYYLGSLERWYSSATITRFIKGIEASLYGRHPQTSRKYYDAWLRFMFAGAYFASHGDPEAAFFLEINEGQASTTALDSALALIFRLISNLEDFSICRSSNDKSRNSLWEGIRAMCKLFVGEGIFPVFKFNAFMNVDVGTRTPVLADLSRQAGRFIAPATAAEHQLAILGENVELLAALRAELEDVVIDALAAFRKSRNWAYDTTLPSVEQIDDYIDEPNFRFRTRFGNVGGDFRTGCIAKLLWAIFYDGYELRCQASKFEQFLIQSGKRIRLYELLGASSKALTSAFYILMIDTGWNAQPLTDLQADPFIGTTVQGRRRLRSLGGVKTRPRPNEIETPLEEEGDVHEVDLPSKSSDVRLTGVQVIEAWLEITAPLRERAKREGDKLAASRLWVWRQPKTNRLGTNLRSIQTQWWPEFIASIKAHKRLGGLPITGRVIRKTKANIAAMKGSFSAQLPMAMLDHSLHQQSKAYLTDDTIRALYEDLMRRFLDLLEAVHVIDLDDAALKLGISAEDLHHRQQLGLSSGLDFCLIRPPIVEMNEGLSPTAETLAGEATSFVPNKEAMENLHVARSILRRMQDYIAPANPGRWIRTWLPWHAIVEAIAEQLEGSRHRVAFRHAVAAAERKLAVGIKAFPVIW